MQIRWWLWPNLLSLDAPLVAILWDLLFARCLGARVRPVAVATMALWVWLIYASDRLLDGLQAANSLEGETPRHRFYRINRAAIVPWLAAGLAVALVLSASQLRFRLFLYGIPLGLLVAAYFVIVHRRPRALQNYWPKELAVAILFAAGALLPVWANLTVGGMSLVAPGMLLIGILWMNAVGIERWEARLGTHDESCHRPGLTGLIAGHLGTAGFAIVIISVLLISSGAISMREQPLYASIITSAIALAGVDRLHGSVERDALRVLADAALLTPLLFLPFIAR